MGQIVVSNRGDVSARSEGEAAGRLLHERLLTEAHLVSAFLLSGPPATPEEAAYVLDVVSSGELNEPTLALLADALTG